MELNKNKDNLDIFNRLRENRNINLPSENEFHDNKNGGEGLIDPMKKIRDHKLNNNLNLNNNELNNNNNIKKKSIKDTNDDIHIIFSTSCNGYQDWQSIVLFYSAMQINQPGRITRLASGCTKEEEWKLEEIYKKLGPKFNIHFTPAYHIEDMNGDPYIYFNKCNAVNHWLVNNEPEESVIAIVDPDFMFLSPLTPYIRNMTNLIYSSHIHLNDIPEKIIPGEAVAQGYAMGTRWLDWDKEFICGKNSPCLSVNRQQASKYYAVGPPYIMHKEDMKNLSPLWVEFTKRIVPYHKEFLAEMFGYSMAAAHLRLPHTTLDSFMISNAQVTGEGWDAVDQAQNYCEGPISDDKIHLPTFLHYCQSYRLGQWVFYKSRLPKNILSCEMDLLEEPPVNLPNEYLDENLDFELKMASKNNRGMQKNKMINLLKRNSYMLCTIYRELNKAFMWYKRKICINEEPNFDKKIRLPRPSHL